MTNANKLTADDVRHVAELAELELKEKEVIKFSEQLTDVISYINELDEVDTKGVTETSQTTGLTNNFREDETEKGLTQEAALDQAPDTHNGYFKVEGIFEEE